MKIIYRVTVEADGQEPEIMEYDEADRGGAVAYYNNSIGLEGVYLVYLDKVTWDEETQHSTIVPLERSEAR
jgi:hypothetical protein